MITIYCSSVISTVIDSFDMKVYQKLVCLVTKETTVKSMPKMKYEICTENNEKSTFTCERNIFIHLK